MSVKLDLHVHSESRRITFINAGQLRKHLQQNKLDGVAITNFFDISHAVSLKEELKEYIIIVGQEIWSNDGHIIGLGLEKKINDFQSAEEVINCIHEQGGIAIAPHPYTFLGVGKKIMSLPIDAIESFNAYMGAAIIPNYLAKVSAIKRNITQVASTDTTDPALVGRSYTEVMAENHDSILESIRTGKVKLCKRSLPVPVLFFVKNMLGFKNLKPCSIHAVPCLICGKSMALKIFKRKYKCIDCGKILWSRIACCNGHYLCMECIIKRDTT